MNLYPDITRRAIDPRLVEVAQQRGYSPLMARILAGRGVGDVSFSLDRIDPPFLLQDINKAADRVILAIRNGEKIALSGDHDADGVCSCVVLHAGLSLLGADPDNLVYAISHRLRQGYGLNQSLAEDLANNVKPSLVITADNGSSDEARIAYLKEHGIDTVVTDHHQIPEDNPPLSAVAFVNPQRKECAFPDKSIAGCFVAWHLVRHVRDRMVSQGLLPSSASDMTHLLQYVAVGTQADCVSLASPNNRAVLQYGLDQMNAKVAPCWAALDDKLFPLTSETLSFQICPRIAAAGRLDEAIPGIKWLLSESIEEAEHRFQVISKANEDRKSLQKEMTESAVLQASVRVRNGHLGISVFLPLGHTGTHGIVASRLVEQFGRPAVMLAPKQDDHGTIGGSARSIPGFHLRDALQVIQDRYGLMKAFGGHPMAAGLSLDADKVDDFRDAFNEVVSERIDRASVGPKIESDGSLDAELLTLGSLEEIGSLEPYGQEFPAPVFDDEFDVIEAKYIGDGTHMRLNLARETGDGQTKIFKGVWFRCRDDVHQDVPVANARRARVIYSLSSNTYRGNTSLQLMVKSAMPLFDV